MPDLHSQFWGLSVYIKFNLSHLLYIIDGKVGVCIIGKEMFDKSELALISIDTYTHTRARTHTHTHTHARTHTRAHIHTQSIQVVLLISVHC